MANPTIKPSKVEQAIQRLTDAGLVVNRMGDTYIIQANGVTIDNANAEDEFVYQATKYANAAEAGIKRECARREESEFRVLPSVEAEIRAFVEKGKGISGSTRALLENDARRAITQASGDRYVGLRASMLFILNQIPEKCWGSLAAVETWRMLSPEQRAYELERSTYQPKSET